MAGPEKDAPVPDRERPIEKLPAGPKPKRVRDSAVTKQRILVAAEHEFSQKLGPLFPLAGAWKLHTFSQ